MNGQTACRRVRLGILLLALPAGLPARALERIAIDAGSPTVYLANSANPGVGLDWNELVFDDSGWSAGSFGIGYETATGAEHLVATPVPPGSVSIYTRTWFNVEDAASVQSLHLGLDYDDGYVAWLNGVEIARSASMPPGPTAWNATPAPHESSNLPFPDHDIEDVSAVGLPLLVEGANLLALGVWNASAASTDLVAVPRLTLDQADSLVRGPYLQSASDTGITLRWRTETPTDSRVVYGTDPGNLQLEVTDRVARLDHKIELGGLTPDTTYHYAIGDSSSLLVGSDERHVFTTAPLPGSRKPMRIWVLGDSGTGNAAARSVRDAFYLFSGGFGADLLLMLGDNAYDSGTDAEYQTTLFDIYPETLRRTVLWPTLGNHDAIAADPSSETGPYFDIFELPAAGETGGLASGTEAYYSFDYANVHFVVLDSEGHDRTPSGSMLPWLAADLASTAAEWIVAYWHHPPYSKASHNSDVEEQLIEMREYVVPILEDHGVDLVLSGHSHAYERSYLLKDHHGDSGTFLESMKLDAGDGCDDPALDGCDSGDGAYAKLTGGDGTVYAVVGSSGRVGGGTFDHPAHYRGEPVLGSAILTLDGGRLDLEFLDAAGTVRDRFAIVKPDCPSGQTPPGEVGNLRFAAGPAKSSLTWDPDPAAGAYDLLRGDLAGLPVGGGTEDCVVPAGAAAGAVDSQVPPPGSGAYYLVRGRNACGAGTYGHANPGGERYSAACP